MVLINLAPPNVSTNEESLWAEGFWRFAFYWFAQRW
jgi:hypothetical protein